MSIADAEAQAIVQKYCTTAKVVIHPPDDPEYRAFCIGDAQLLAKGAFERYQDIVRTCDLIVAAPKSTQEEQHSGTWATIRYAKRRYVTVVVLDP